VRFAHRRFESGQKCHDADSQKIGEFIMGIPGWDSVAGAGWWATLWFWVSIGSLFLLGISEVISHRYTVRKDFLVEQEQTAEKRLHDEEMAHVHRDTAQANERAAELSRETATLQWQLEQQRQKLAQRQLSAEQKSTMISALRGKLSQVMLVTQNDPEAKAFTVQLMDVFSEAGVKMYAHEPPREDKWFAPAGLMMYSPAGVNESQLQNNSLYRALKAANLFGGTTGQPFVSGQPTVIDLSGPSPTFALIKGYTGDILYVGQKSPF
jgi:hypothetical protein